MLNLLFLKSLAIYTLFALIMYNISIKGKSISTSKKMPKQYIWCVLVFALISGLRWDVGTDYLGYLQMYKDLRLGLELSRTDVEAGFALITKAFGILHLHYSLYFAFWAFLQCFFIVKSVFDEKYKVVPYIMLLIPLSSHYISLMNGLRQMVVACSFIWATQFIINREFKKYALWVFVCSFIHQSVWILLPVYFLNRAKGKWNNSVAQFSILFICILLGNVPSWITLMSNVSGLLDLLGYEKFSSQMDYLVSSEAMNDYNWGPRMLSTLAVYSIIILFNDRAKRFLDSQRFNLFYKIFFIGICLSFLFCNTSIFNRPVDYLILFSLPVCGYTLYYFKETKRTDLFYLLIFCSAFYVIVSCFTESRVPEDMRNSYLYQFCFSHWDIINNPIVRPH